MIGRTPDGSRMLILHHYALSPFAEKIRLVFGLKGLAWHSVIIPDRLPKAEYVALTGGYRRTPSLQIGADVYCDTRLIAAELDARWPQPRLFPGGTDAHRAIEARAETALFWACALLVTGVNHAALPADFHADRAAMRGRPPPTPGELRAAGERARPRLAAELAWVEGMLAEGRPWLLGDAPGLADLAVYHGLWFLEQLPRRLLDEFAPSAALRAWMARVAALGHGRRTELSASAALAQARAAEPEPLPAEAEIDYAPGSAVLVEPEEGTSPPVAGRVAACSTTRIALDREDPRAGHVRVHFPRAGYRVRAA